MKANKKRHYNFAVSRALIRRKNALSKNSQSMAIDKPAVDARELARLNQLVSKPPFCAWQRPRNYDPL